jgi:hypothetical protein
MKPSLSRNAPSNEGHPDNEADNMSTALLFTHAQPVVHNFDQTCLRQSTIRP